MNPRTGRPPKPPEERRSVSREIRFTPAEDEIMRQAGGSNWSEWARDVLLRAARRKR